MPGPFTPLSSKLLPAGSTIFGVLIAASYAFAQGAACDKACLLGTADAYVAALVSHDASKAPMAPNAKFTEQTKVLTTRQTIAPVSSRHGR